MSLTLCDQRTAGPAARIRPHRPHRPAARCRAARPPAGRRAGLALAAAVGLTASAARSAVVPLFVDAGGSANHAPGSPAGANVAAALSNPNARTPAFDGDYDPSVITFPSGGSTGNTTARIGVSNTQDANSARILFARGTGVSQTDPGGAQSFSTLEFTFGARWTIPAPGGFGMPIGSAFNLPVGARVGPGGSATAFVDVHWNLVRGTMPVDDARTPYTETRSFGLGAQVSAFFAPAASFPYLSLNAGDEVSMTGTIRFTANNDEAPTLIEIPTLENFPEFAGRPELTTEASMSVGGVPEPTVLGPAAAAGLLALGARRRRRAGGPA